MKRLLLTTLIALLFSSCARIFTPKYQDIEIWTTTPAVVVIDEDSTKLNHRINYVTIERSGSPRNITVIRDSDTTDYTLKPKLSYTYLVGNCFTFLGVGFLIDWDTPKRWTYDDVLLLGERGLRKIYKSEIVHLSELSYKGTVNGRISFPYVNAFHLQDTEGNTKSSIGFMGIALGMDYFYSDKNFINITGNWVMNSFIPFPAPIRYRGVVDHMFSTYGTLSHNHMIGGFSAGYGLSYGLDKWNTKDHGDYDDDHNYIEGKPSINRTSHSMGFLLSAYYYTSKSFYIGFTYRPMFVQFTNNISRFAYQHTMSLDFGWRINIAGRREGHGHLQTQMVRVSNRYAILIDHSPCCRIAQQRVY